MELNHIATTSTPQRKQVVRKRVPANIPALQAYPYEGEEDDDWPEEVRDGPDLARMLGYTD